MLVQQQMLADQPTLAVRDQDATGGTRGDIEVASDLVGGLGDRPAVGSEPVDHRDAEAGRRDGVTEGAQKGPVLVDAGQQQDLRCLDRPVAPCARRAAGVPERPRGDDAGELTLERVRVVGRPPERAARDGRRRHARHP